MARGEGRSPPLGRMIAKPKPEPLRPHAPLPDYYDDSGDNAARDAYLVRMFDATASDYDRIERVLAFGTGRSYRRQALLRAGLGTGAQALDVGIGTGLVAREALAIVGASGSVTGVDPSAGMLAQVGTSSIELLSGRAEALPVANASADFLSMGYALRHINDLSAAFAEFARALRPGGRLLVLEITRPQGRVGLQLLKTYMRVAVPLIARAVARQAHTPEMWRYYWDTIEACVPPARVLEALADAGFRDVRRHVELGIFSEFTALKPA